MDTVGNNSVLPLRSSSSVAFLPPYVWAEMEISSALSFNCILGKMQSPFLLYSVYKCNLRFIYKLPAKKREIPRLMVKRHRVGEFYLSKKRNSRGATKRVKSPENRLCYLSGAGMELDRWTFLWFGGSDFHDSFSSDGFRGPDSIKKGYMVFSAKLFPTQKQSSRCACTGNPV